MQGETPLEMLIRTLEEAKEKSKEKELPIAGIIKGIEQGSRNSSGSISCSNPGLPNHRFPSSVSLACLLLL